MEEEEEEVEEEEEEEEKEEVEEEVEEVSHPAATKTKFNHKSQVDKEIASPI